MCILIMIRHSDTGVKELFSSNRSQKFKHVAAEMKQYVAKHYDSYGIQCFFLFLLKWYLFQ